MKYLTLVSILVLAPAQIAAGECKSDSECKGDRVCYKEECLSPAVAEKYEQADFERSRAGEAEPDGEKQQPTPDQTKGTTADQSPTPPTETATPPEQTSASTPATTPNPESQTDSAPPVAPNPIEPTTASQPTDVDIDNLGQNQSALSVVLKKPTAGAVVYVDGQKMGSAPWRGVVAPGEHTVRVEAPGKRPKTEDTQIWPSRTRVLELRLLNEGNYAPFGVLVAISSVTLPLGISGAALYAAASPFDSSIYEYNATANEKRAWGTVMGVNLGLFAFSLPSAILLGTQPRKNQRPAGWLGVGMGGAGLLLGLSAAIVVASQYQDYKDKCPLDRCNPDEVKDKEMEHYNAWRVIATAGITTGAVIAATGVILLLTGRDKRKGDKVGFGISPVSVGLQGRF